MTVKPTESLHLAVAEANKVGATIELQGIYSINQPLNLRGARLRGTHPGHLGNWNLGGTVIHCREGAYISIGNAPDGANSAIHDVAFVFYHQNTPDAVGLKFESDAFGAVIHNVMIDRAGRGIVLDPSIKENPRSLGHRFHDICVQSFRRTAIFSTIPINTTDHHFTGLTWLKGFQGADYIKGAVAPTRSPCGIEGLPSSSHFENLLIEGCRTGIRVLGALDTTVSRLMLDHVVELGIDGGNPKPKPALYGNKFLIGQCIARAARPHCILLKGGNVEIRQQSLSCCMPNASWITHILPAVE